jgi:hypothetical protein
VSAAAASMSMRMGKRVCVRGAGRSSPSALEGLRSAGLKPSPAPGTAAAIVDRLTFGGNITETGTDSLPFASPATKWTVRGILPDR